MSRDGRGGDRLPEFDVGGGLARQATRRLERGRHLEMGPLGGDVRQAPAVESQGDGFDQGIAHATLEAPIVALTRATGEWLDRGAQRSSADGIDATGDGDRAVLQ